METLRTKRSKVARAWVTRPRMVALDCGLANKASLGKIRGIETKME